MICQSRSSAVARRAVSRRGPWGALLALVTLLNGGAAVAASPGDELEPLLAAERQRALKMAGEVTAFSERLKTDAAARVAALGVAGAAARADLDGIRKELLAAMTKDQMMGACNTEMKMKHDEMMKDKMKKDGMEK